LRKALKTLTTELAVECSLDVVATLHRRNEILAVNQAVVSKQPGGVAVQGTESRKYAAVIAEYTTDGKKGKKTASPKAKLYVPFTFVFFIIAFLLLHESYTLLQFMHNIQLYFYFEMEGSHPSEGAG